MDDWFSLELAGEVVAQFYSVNGLALARAGAENSNEATDTKNERDH